MKLSDLMRKNKIYIPLACGGCGACGKCRVRLADGSIVLACKYDVTEEYDVSEVMPLWNQDGIVATSVERSNSHSVNDEYNVAVDIGTTTIAVAIVDSVANIVDEYTMVNHQNVYGADVVSRIKASNEGKQEELKRIIQCDLIFAIEYLLKKNKIKHSSIKKAVICCNTTMTHLLMGYSCEGLGKYPFEPVNLDFIEKNGFAILGDEKFSNVSVIIMPSISTYIGGDIIAGIYESEITRNNKKVLFIDLGTNGEMAIGSNEGVFVTSTAAGPAFEAGNIEHGTASIPGAICSVTITNMRKKAMIKTINGCTPIGICGTGLVSAIAEMRRTDIIDENGTLSDEFFDVGYPLTDSICITQKDIREFQMAKSAIRSGVEILCKRAGIFNMDEIDMVYIAGSFGNNIDINKAIYINMLPSEIKSPVKAIGNSSLQGAIDYLSNKMGRDTITKIIALSKEVILANEPEFAELYMNYMFL